MSKVIYILLLISLFSCVSTSIPKNKERAKSRIAKHLESIDNIVKLHPELNKSFSDTIKDTITIDSSKIVIEYKVKVDTNSIDSLLEIYCKNINSKDTIYLTKLRNRIIEKSLSDTTINYEDSIANVTISVIKGKYSIKIVTNPKSIIIDTQIIDNISYDCDRTKDFWKDWKFWILIILLLIIYLINKRINIS